MPPRRNRRSTAGTAGAGTHRVEDDMDEPAAAVVPEVVSPIAPSTASTASMSSESPSPTPLLSSRTSHAVVPILSCHAEALDISTERGRTISGMAWMLIVVPTLLLLLIAYDCFSILQAGGALQFSLSKYEATLVPSRENSDLLPAQLQAMAKLAQNHTDEQDWAFVGRFDNVDTFNKKIPGSKLLAFRGVALLDVHISQAMGPFINVTHALEWVSVLKSIKRMSLPNDNSKSNNNNNTAGDRCNYMDEDTDIIYQVLKLPWPITQRDVLLERHFHIDDELRQATVSFRSVEDDRAPIPPHTIRVDSRHTMWRFTVVPIEGKTHPKQCVDLSTCHSSSNDTSASSSSLVDAGNGNSGVGGMVLRRLTTGVRRRLSALWRTLRSIFGQKEKSVPVAINRPEQKPTDVSRDGCSCAKLFEGRDGGGLGRSWTYVEVETVVDSKGMIPVWFINYMQRFWPAMTLRTFRNLAKKGVIEAYDRMSCW